MGERTSYEPGTFSWTDLGTTEADAAKSFYASLFGWEYDDMPAGEGMTYSMARLGDHTVAALYGMQQQGVPPYWLAYVTVDSADEAVERAKELGANVIQGPLDVFDAGRMAVLGDPAGAVFAVWEPRQNIGATLVNDAGSMCLNQLNTTDADGAKEFYSGLFGWRIEEIESPGAPYFSIHNGDALGGGMMPMPEGQGAPPHWLVYFTSPDLDAHAAQIRELGGTIVLEPMPIPSGRILVAQDPQGAFFALFEGEVDP